ncbi:hypothetical protein GW17_00020438 [Ensete ventricosum]|nr:hypothetical protein GW17_00020438 [Ensete ventricosum]RZR79051.1 hypothetical protein BHM03_00004638 [Ensete ventricosum]
MPKPSATPISDSSLEPQEEGDSRAAAVDDDGCESLGEDQGEDDREDEEEEVEEIEVEEAEDEDEEEGDMAEGEVEVEEEEEGDDGELEEEEVVVEEEAAMAGADLSNEDDDVSYRCSYQGFSYRSVLPVPVRQVIGTRTARYRAVPPKSTVDGRFNRRWLIEGEIDHRRSIEGEKGKKKKKKRRKKKEERRGEEERIPRIVLARASLPLAGCPSAAVALARRSPASRCRPRS